MYFSGHILSFSFILQNLIVHCKVGVERSEGRGRRREGGKGRNMKYALASTCFSFHLNLLNLFQDLTDRREFYFGML